MGTALGSEVESVVVLRAARASLSGALLRAAAPRACVPHAAPRPPHAATNVNNS